jgi:tRNA(His) 5'-end guanylyltransferase
MVSQHYFSHTSLQKLSSKEQQEKLFIEKDVNWNDYTSAQKRGVYVRKEVVDVVLTQEQLDNIPEGKRPVNNTVPRNRMVVIDMPPLIKVVNAIEVIFDKEQPITK